MFFAPIDIHQPGEPALALRNRVGPPMQIDSEFRITKPFGALILTERFKRGLKSIGRVARSGVERFVVRRIDFPAHRHARRQWAIGRQWVSALRSRNRANAQVIVADRAGRFVFPQSEGQADPQLGCRPAVCEDLKFVPFTVVGMLRWARRRAADQTGPTLPAARSPRSRQALPCRPKS